MVMKTDAPEKLDVVKGEHGEFYTLPINMERYDYTTSYNSKQEVSVVGCPKCGNMQIDIQEGMCL